MSPNYYWDKTVATKFAAAISHKGVFMRKCFMKKQSNSLVMLAIMLVLGFTFVATFVSCANESDEPIVSSFEGTWRNAGNDGISHITYIFRGSDYLCAYDYPFEGGRIGGVYWGPFTFTATTITFRNMTDMRTSPWTQNYTLNSNTFILEQDAEKHFSGTFVKQ